MEPRAKRLKAAPRGVALILVLALLVLVAALVMAFLSSVTSDVTAAKSYTTGVTVQQLAETATQLVMSQILDGTQAFEIPRDPRTPSRPPGGLRLTWTSQPGLIRTFTSQGEPGRVFKLYSSSNMVVPPVRSGARAENYDALRETAAEVPAEWSNRRAFYTDLNEPALLEQPSKALGPIERDGRFYAPSYPILDPRAAGEVEGFQAGEPAGVTKPSDPAAPMPVQWLYLLKDGSITAPSFPSGNGDRASWEALADSDPRKPSAANPIVGRIAFWTDDETCKVNLNTAAEGVFWDRPWADSETERAFATPRSEVFSAARPPSGIPLQSEFNRTPGHPAQTSLSTIFGPLFPVGAPGQVTHAQLEPYLGAIFTPGGSSRASLAPRVGNPYDRYGNQAPLYLTKKADRLYASVDEVLFTPNLQQGQRERLRPGLDRAFLEKAKFFLTAQSRAPEANVFGQPRISLWPLQMNEQGQRNAKDRLLAFCATTKIRGQTEDARYYFQRLSAYTGDGRKVFGNPIPSSQDGHQDWEMVPRNPELYAYLQALTAEDVPGYGGNFLAKYPAPPGEPRLPSDRDQILTEMVDYLRSNVNASQASLTPKYSYLPPRPGGNPVPGEAQVIPLRIGATMGFGRYSTVTEAALVFIATARDGAGQTSMMQALLLLEPFTASPGFPSMSPELRYAIRGLEQFQVNGQPLGFAALDPDTCMPRNLVTSRVGFSGGGHATAFMGLQALLAYYDRPRANLPKILGRDDEETKYPFYSAEVPVSGGQFVFTGGPISVDIYSGYDPAARGGMRPSPENLVQTLHFDFPSATWPVPSSSNSSVAARLGAKYDAIIQEGDVVRGVGVVTGGPMAGDLRQLAALPEVSARHFAPQAAYFSATTLAAHSLRTSTGTPEDGIHYLHGANGAPADEDAAGQLVPGVALPANREPAVPRGLAGAWLHAPGGGHAPGDWENGMGGTEDGPYIDKTDENNRITGMRSTEGYFSRGLFTEENSESFSPNRQVASAVTFGALPTGIMATAAALREGLPEAARPWQTLLFCPNPASYAALGGDPHRAHPGFGTQVETAAAALRPPYTLPPDHVLLDFFTMPVVEPYALSEPFSTAGKINLNAQIVPFTYLTRDTALRAVLKATEITAIPTTATDYKTPKPAGSGAEYRYAVDLDQTMAGWHQRTGADNNPFVSASQICELFLVPKVEPAVSYAQMPEWWRDRALTGDNARESPYNSIYPRLTTKSNTFTVHLRVQVLRQVPSAQGAPEWSAWDETRDRVLAEYRGSTLLERYLDPADPNLPDFALPANRQASLDEFYRFRVLSSQRFAP